jgi:hypothetical protein
MNRYENGKLVIESDFEIRLLRKENEDIDLLIPVDLRVLNLNIDKMPDYMDSRFQFRDVRNIIIRFTTNKDNNYCTIHLLRSVDLLSAMVNFIMNYESHSIRIIRNEFSIDMYLNPI